MYDSILEKMVKVRRRN